MVRKEPCRREAPFNCLHCGTQLEKTDGSEVCICGMHLQGRDKEDLPELPLAVQYEKRPVTRGAPEKRATSPV